ncbi:MAG: sensor signal transduction histidine kinase [Labilithrix sp.]|nr:sensor signal transduction histidine kinase [Labilithrix sp.]
MPSERPPPPSHVETLLDSAACALMLTSEDGTFLRVNKAFCAWLGRTPAELVGRKRFQDLLTMGGRIFHQTHWAPLLRMQGSISEVKLEVQHADGTTIPMVLNAIRAEQDGAAVYEMAAFMARDRDRYERELVLSRKRLEELVIEATRLRDESKDRALFAEQMIGIVSHDLRNPLSSISMAAALLGGGELSVREQRFVGQITRATQRATRLIADLLDFTQARLGGGLAVTLASIDLHEAVAEGLDELRLVHPSRTLLHVRSGEGPCVADASRLEQLVGNLVSNAAVYGQPDAPITVTSRVEPASFSIAVHNSGVPIPPETLATLFRPMTRGVAAGSANRSVGLGLFIVGEIAKRHGGAASVTSTAESGTTFRATFPRAASFSGGRPA